jgi:hypothetical protein
MSADPPRLDLVTMPSSQRAHFIGHSAAICGRLGEGRWSLRDTSHDRPCRPPAPRRGRGVSLEIAALVEHLNCELQIFNVSIRHGRSLF